MPPREIHLNHAGTSWPKPPAVVDAVHAAMTRPPGQWGERFDAARSAIATFLGIRDPAQLLLTPGCTSSLAVGIGDVDLGGRRRVLTSVWEHHAMHRPLLKLGETGITVDYVPANDESPLDLDRLDSELSRGDVGLVAITAAANVTGDVLPYEGVTELAHGHGAQVLLDAAQVVGWLDLDFAAFGADVVAFGGHKGLQGPWGIGGLYVAEGARMTSAGARCEAPSPDYRARPGYCDAGSVDQVALAGLHAAVQWLNGTDRTAQLRSAREQIARAEAALTDAGARCFATLAPSGRMPTVAFSLEGRPSEEVAAALASRGITVGSGLQCSPLAHRALGSEREGLVRLSVGIGQDVQDLGTAVEVVREHTGAG